MIYMGLWSNFNCSSMTDRLFVIYSMDITYRSIAAHDLFIIFIFLINKNIITLIIQKVQFNAELPLHYDRTLLVNIEGGLCPL